MIKNISLLIDSGAHGLYNQHVLKPKKYNDYSWFESKEFYKYLDNYAKFIITNSNYVQSFVCVDVIFRPDLTFKSFRYLYDKGIVTMPVIHYGTDLKWVKKYLDLGIDYIGIGGLGQQVSKTKYINWADRLFTLLCNNQEKVPCLKTHGFAMTSHDLMLRYPWYSVDSKAWLDYASYGFVIYPRFVNNRWDYTKPFIVVRLSVRKTNNKRVNIYLADDNSFKKKQFLSYINYKGYRMGKSKLNEKGEEEVIEIGLCNDFKLRAELNAMYFIDFAHTLPSPRRFEVNKSILI